MLAASAPTVEEVVEGMGEVALETKLDGIRLQAHVWGGAGDRHVRLFTRTLEEVTDRMPEVVEALAALPVGAAVLDGEVIALRADGRPHPFQVTGARTASSADPQRLRAEVPLTTYLFDLLHQDGDDLVDLPGRLRWQRLVQAAPGLVVPRLVTDDAATARAWFDERVDSGHEGVVVKSLEAPYAAGRRGAGWVKVKPRHTFDLVVVAVEWGSGRRRGTLSNIHLAARDEHTGDLVMLGKTFKGMTDEMLAWQTERFLGLETHREGHVVHVRPEQVVEVAVDGVQRSRRYPGGVALRFARVLRYREDKPAAEVDSVQTVTRVAGAALQ
jgi:DNA ligase 1